MAAPLNASDVVLVTGGSGTVGRVLVRYLMATGYDRLLRPSRSELELTDHDCVDRYFAAHRPTFVFMLAAKVGGIGANIADPVGFLVENARITVNLFEACRRHNVQRGLFLGSSCVYPRDCPQPMKEEYLMGGPLEPTNESYALAKLLGLQLTKAYRQQYGMRVISAMPCNVYGPTDHFDLERSHVLSALVRRFADATRDRAKSVTLWGTGAAKREFIHADDLAAAMVFLARYYDRELPINVGTGVDVTIRELAEMVAQETDFRGEIRWDPSKPDGMPRKCLDITRLSDLGFRAGIPLREGVREVIAVYRHTIMASSAQ